MGAFELSASADPASREIASQTKEFLAKSGAACNTRFLDPARLMEAVFSSKYDATVITFEMPVTNALPWFLFFQPNPFAAFGQAMPEITPDIATARSAVDGPTRRKAWESLIAQIDQN